VEGSNQFRKSQNCFLLDLRVSSAYDEINDFWFVGTELLGNLKRFCERLLFQKRCKNNSFSENKKLFTQKYQIIIIEIILNLLAHLKTKCWLPCYTDQILISNKK